MKKKALILTLAITILAAVWLLRGVWLPFLCENPQTLIDKHFSSGGLYTDRHGRILKVFADERGDFAVYTSLASHSAQLLNAVLIAEDRNFYTHPGFDIRSMARALWQNVSSRRIVSGASTISQQLIRVVKPRSRTISTKISELLTALRLENIVPKNLILEKYLNAVCMFGNIRGTHMAALLMFGKSPEMLNLAESATLAAAIQAPGRFDPFTKAGNIRLLKRRNWLLNEMLKAGKCTAKEFENAISTIIPTHKRHRPFNAPHFCELAVNLYQEPKGTLKTTIDLDTQNFLHSTISSHMPRLMKSGANQAGAIIADAGNLEILAMTGSAQYGPIAGGFNNACIARRSGGSILKPFLYALAIENGYFPSFVIPDTMQTFKTPQGEYIPFNADRRSYGPVSIRAALGNSLNISAVKMLNLTGIKNFYKLLVDLKLLKDKPGAADFFGLGLAIGNPEVRMLDLIEAYGVFCNAGILKTVKFFTDQTQLNKPVISPKAAFLIYDILSDPAARLFTFGNPAFYKSKRPVAIKTGTSTDYRDAWLIAVNPDFIIGIWVGNFSGAPTRALSGATACGPIYKNLIDFLEEVGSEKKLAIPAGIHKKAVCSISGQFPGQHCQMVGYDFFPDTANMPGICNFHVGNSDSHELPADYASWIRSRKKHLDADPFKLSHHLEVTDPYCLIGIEMPKVAIQKASGPIVIAPLQQSGTWDSVKIVSPHNGDCYIMSSSHENYALLRAIPAVPVSEVIWLVNGKEFIRTPPPYEAYWPLAPGTHRICAITESEAAEEIEIRVER